VSGAALDLRALVTGASSGIGAAFARALRRRGERLVLVARRADRLEALARELGGDDAVAVVPLDLTASGAGQKLEEEMKRRGFSVDLLVNNAGVGDTGRFWEEPLDKTLAMIDLNVRSLVELTRRFLPGMIERRRGRVINVVSNGAFQPVPFLTVYAATKSCVLSFTEGLATEVAGTGVTLQALCPGLTQTEFFEVARTGPGLLVNRLPKMTSEDVVASSLRGLDRGRLRVIPGFPNRLLAALTRLAPGWLARTVAATLYRPR
jgi:hypothetical protein